MAIILIVDDRSVNRQYLVTLLGYCGHRMIEAGDGAKALALARTERPDLIITDIIMPTMDGEEMVHALHADPALAATPVIFYSASYRENEARAVAASCGVSIVLPKPADPEVVLQVVNKALGSRAVHAEVPAGVKPPGPDLGLLTDALGKHLSEQQHSAARLAVIIELGLDLTGDRDPLRMTRRFCKGARDIVSARFASVGLLSEDGRTLAHFCKDGMAKEDAMIPAPFPLRGQLKELVEDGKPRRLSSTFAMSDFGLPDANTRGSSFLGVGVATERGTYGWLCFCNKVGANEFTDEDERLAITLAAQLAVAYENVLLLAKGQRDAEALRLQASALTATANAIIITDRQGLIVWANPAFTKLTGYSAEEVIGQNPRLFKSGRHATAFYADLWKTVLAGRFWHGEMINRRKDGSLYPEEQTITAVSDLHGEITHFISIKHDTTERRQAAEALRARDNAEAANRLKSEFLANMSHELRTPLNGIIGFTEFLIDEKPGPLKPKQKEYLSDVLNSARHLLQLINDVLDLAKVEAGKMELRPEIFPLRKAVEEVTAVIKGIAHKKHIIVGVEIGDGLDTVTLDQHKFKQVLYNLLSNAVKFTDDGGQVDIHARRLDPNRLEVRVRDTGIGIKAEDISRLFTEFEQLDSGTARRFEGTGLGLALTKKIVEFQGGRIGVQSESGKGSTFSVVLPLRTEKLEAT